MGRIFTPVRRCLHTTKRFARAPCVSILTSIQAKNVVNSVPAEYTVTWRSPQALKASYRIEITQSVSNCTLAAALSEQPYYFRIGMSQGERCTGMDSGGGCRHFTTTQPKCVTHCTAMRNLVLCNGNEKKEH